MKASSSRADETSQLLGEREGSRFSFDGEVTRSDDRLRIDLNYDDNITLKKIVKLLGKVSLAAVISIVVVTAIVIGSSMKDTSRVDTSIDLIRSSDYPHTKQYVEREGEKIDEHW